MVTAISCRKACAEHLTRGPDICYNKTIRPLPLALAAAGYSAASLSMALPMSSEAVLGGE